MHSGHCLILLVYHDGQLEKNILSRLLIGDKKIVLLEKLGF